MPAPYHNLLSKNDRALMAFINTRNVGTTNVYPAKRSQNKELDCVICWSEKATEAPIYSGAYLAEGSVMVKTSAPEETGDADGTRRLVSEALVAKVFDSFNLIPQGETTTASGEYLAGLITAAARALALSDPANYSDLADYTCLNFSIKGIEAAFDEEGAWTDTMNWEMLICPSNVS